MCFKNVQLLNVAEIVAPGRANIRLEQVRAEIKCFQQLTSPCKYETIYRVQYFKLPCVCQSRHRRNLSGENTNGRMFVATFLFGARELVSVRVGVHSVGTAR